MNDTRKFLMTVTASAVIASSISAQQLPLNNIVDGGQGNVQLDGQEITAASLGLTGTVISVAVIAGVLFVTLLSTDGTTSTTEISQ